MNALFMGWNYTDVAPEGHPNEGLTILQRMERYGLDAAEGATAYNKLMRIEREEAVKAGIAPEIPITPEAARVYAPEIAAWERKQRMKTYLLLGGGALLVYLFMGRRRRA